MTDVDQNTDEPTLCMDVKDAYGQEVTVHLYSDPDQVTIQLLMGLAHAHLRVTPDQARELVDLIHEATVNAEMARPLPSADDVCGILAGGDVDATE